jgi:hypothetical protein
LTESKPDECRRISLNPPSVLGSPFLTHDGRIEYGTHLIHFTPFQHPSRHAVCGG